MILWSAFRAGSAGHTQVFPGTTKGWFRMALARSSHPHSSWSVTLLQAGGACSLLDIARFLLRSPGQNKSPGQPRLNEWGPTLHFLMGGAAKSHCKYVATGRDEELWLFFAIDHSYLRYFLCSWFFMLKRLRKVVNILCKRQHIKYFRFDESQSLSQLCNFVFVAQKQP